MGKIKGVLTASDYLDIKEFNYLCDSLHKDKEYLWELYCRFSFCTALRGGDILSTKWKDVLNQPEFMKVEQKTQKTRRITFNTNVMKKITELYKLLGNPNVNDYMFLNPKTGSPLTLIYINRLLKTFIFRYKLSIKNFSTHTFRKTFGRYVYEQNNKSDESLVLLNTIFRHSNLETTKVYIGIRQHEITSIFNSIKF